MPTTLRNTDILFNDSTTQSTAAVVNTTTVLNATAGASVGSVGTYAFLYDQNLGAGSNRNAGSTVAGSALRYTNAEGTTSGTPSGTWRLMGFTDSSLAPQRASAWLRIS
jgi:hypothetical protein